MASSEGIERVKKDEGMSRYAEHITAEDGVTEKNLTVGRGFNLDHSDARDQLYMAGVHPTKIDAVMKGKEPITEAQADTLFEMMLTVAENDVLRIHPQARDFPQKIKDVLVNMSYQLGYNNLKGFEKMNKAIENRDWEGMAKEMKNSKWGKKQTPTRANRLIRQVKSVPKEEQQVVKAEPELTFEEIQRDALATELADLAHEDSLATGLADLYQPASTTEQETGDDVKEIKPEEEATE